MLTYCGTLLRVPRSTRSGRPGGSDDSRPSPCSLAIFIITLSVFFFPSKGFFWLQEASLYVLLQDLKPDRGRKASLNSWFHSFGEPPSLLPL